MFNKKMCPKQTFCSDFVKLGSEILYLFLAENVELTSRQEFRFRQTFFQNEVKNVFHKMVLILDVLEHIGRIYSPLNLANMQIQKLKFVGNTAPDNQKVLNFMRNPY